MFLQTGLLSPVWRGPALVLAGAAFVAGLTLGGMLHPLAAARSDPATAAPRADVVELASPVPAMPDGRGGYPAEVLRISDGDTFEARVKVWPGIDITTKVRLRGIDTPELKARCPEERAIAAAARAALSKILGEGDIEIRRVTIDKFGGRVDAEASTRATPDVSAALLRAGLARSYTGGRRESWCS